MRDTADCSAVMRVEGMRVPGCSRPLAIKPRNCSNNYYRSGLSRASVGGISTAPRPSTFVSPGGRSRCGDCLRRATTMWPSSLAPATRSAHCRRGRGLE